VLKAAVVLKSTAVLTKTAKVPAAVTAAVLIAEALSTPAVSAVPKKLLRHHLDIAPKYKNDNNICNPDPHIIIAKKQEIYLQ
jgi:hypothetical protein